VGAQTRVTLIRFAVVFGTRGRIRRQPLPAGKENPFAAGRNLPEQQLRVVGQCSVLSANE
jgi:hypothetical protein